MKLQDGELSPEAHRAIVECLKIAARRGRELRLERERAVLAQDANCVPKAQSAGSKADPSRETGTPEADS